MPPLVRTGVSNFFGNMSDVWSFVNSVLQLKLQNAAENFARVQLNTFFGLGGIFDIASEFEHRAPPGRLRPDLGRWGVPAGPYLVLPLLGPSTLRDTVALPVDRKADPRALCGPAGGAQCALYVLRAVDIRPTCCAPAPCWTRRRWTNTASPATPTCKGAAPRSIERRSAATTEARTPRRLPEPETGDRPNPTLPRRRAPDNPAHRHPRPRVNRVAYCFKRREGLRNPAIGRCSNDDRGSIRTKGK